MHITKRIFMLGLAAIAFFPVQAGADPRAADLNAVVTLFSNAATAGAPCQKHMVTNSGILICQLNTYAMVEIGKTLDFQMVIHNGTCNASVALHATPVGLDDQAHTKTLCHVHIWPLVRSLQKVPTYSTICAGAINTAQQAGKLSGTLAQEYLSLCSAP